MRGFITNSQEVFEDIPENRRSAEHIMKTPAQDHSVEKVLGMYWNKDEDVFQYKIRDPQNSPSLTKRELLSYIMKIYDPLGLLTNITIEAKILMQSLWKTGLDWDSQIPNEIMESWDCWD